MLNVVEQELTELEIYILLEALMSCSRKALHRVTINKVTNIVTDPEINVLETKLLSITNRLRGL